MRARDSDRASRSRGGSALRGWPAMTVKSDAELMSALAGGDMAALGELVRRHQQKAFALAFRMLQRRDQAEDVVQEGFLRVCRAAPRYRPQARFTTWLYRIVTNLCLDRARRAKHAPAPLPEGSREPSRDPEPDPVETCERAERVRQAVAALPERQRTAVVLHRYQGLSHAAVAEATGWSRSAVESLLVRAYARLRDELADLRD